MALSMGPTRWLASDTIDTDEVSAEGTLHLIRARKATTTVSSLTAQCGDIDTNLPAIRMVTVKLVVPVRLYPGATSEAALQDTLALCNQAANLASAQAFRMRVTSRQSLQRMAYGDLKAMGLSAQPAIHVTRKVAGAYAALRANIRAGNLGDPDSKRRVSAESKPITFRADAAQPYDDRCLSWQLDRRTVSIWTTAGRLAGIRFRCSPAQLTRLREYRQGESDLVQRDGK